MHTYKLYKCLPTKFQNAKFVNTGLLRILLFYVFTDDLKLNARHAYAGMYIIHVQPIKVRLASTENNNFLTETCIQHY